MPSVLVSVTVVLAILKVVARFNTSPLKFTDDNVNPAGRAKTSPV